MDDVHLQTAGQPLSDGSTNCSGRKSAHEITRLRLLHPKHAICAADLQQQAVSPDYLGVE